MKHLLLLIFTTALLVNSTNLLSQGFPVRNTTGDYDEQVLYNYASCYEYPLTYDGNWRGYVESITEGNFLGFQVNTTQPLGNICYRSRVDAATGFRSDYQQARYCRRNYQISFAKQPTSPVSFRLFYTKQEVDDLISNYNTTYGTTKTYSDLIVVKYNGVNVDLNPSNNSGNNNDYQKIIPAITFYGSAGQYLYAQFDVSGYSEFYLALAAPANTTFYVNDASTAGDVYTTSTGNNNNSGSASAPFATINYAISLAKPGDIILVDAGTYVENIVVNKSLTLKGVQANIIPGPDQAGAQSTVIPAIADNVNGICFAVNATNVTIQGFTIDGNNPGINTGVLLNGVDANAAYGIFNQQKVIDNFLAKNNTIKNIIRAGIFIQGNAATSVITQNNLITQNYFENISSLSNGGRAIALFANGYASVTNNTFTKVVVGVLIANGATPTNLPLVFDNNSIESYVNGIQLQSNFITTSSISIANNIISTGNLNTWTSPGAVTANNGTGIFVGLLKGASSLQIANNSISLKQSGVFLSDNGLSSTINVSGGIISNSSEVGAMVSGAGAKYAFSNVVFSNNKVGIDASSTDISPLEFSFSNVSITGGTTGIRFYGAHLLLTGNTLGSVYFQNQASEYILQTVNAFEGQTVSASSAQFDGVLPGNMSLAQLFATEDKITHQIDVNNVGYFRLKPNEVYVTKNSFAATLPAAFGTATTTPDINRAIAAASPGDIIYVGEGVFNNQVLINKAITLKGAGQGVTIVNGPATLIPPSNFGETAIIQSSLDAGNVNISDLTIDGISSTEQHSILIQGGGSITNCEMRNANNGIFFRDPSNTAHSAFATNNNIHDISYVGMNFEGAALTATAANNIIDLTGAKFGMGFIVGFDFGPLPQLSITNNFIKNYNGFGFSGGCISGSITNNSFTRVAGAAISQSLGTTLSATCNWFGTTDAELIKSYITGNVSYAPWLTNGTDNNTAIGFQPVPNSCDGRQNKFYVNDASLSGDVLTTAVGNDGNNGFSSAPFATLNYALGQAQAGDTILMDAGTYDLNNLTYLLSKPVTIYGANYKVSPNDANNKLLTNNSRTAETILTNGIFTLAANNILFKGITFDLGNHRSFDIQNSSFTNDAVNFGFEKNILKINTAGNFNQFIITGKTVSPPALPVTNGFTFEDNRFEKSGTIAGTTLNFSYVKDILVSNNSFVVTGTTFKTQQVANFGNTGVVSNTSFSNNTVDQASTAILGTQIASIVISGNKIFNTPSSFINTNNFTGSTSIEFNDNLLDNTTGTAFMNFNRTAVSVAGTSNVLKIENNIFNGAGIVSNAIPALQSFGSMILSFNNSVSNPSVILRGNKINYSGDFSSVETEFLRPLTIRGNIANAVIEKNEIVLSTSTTLKPNTGFLLPDNPGITIITDNNNLGWLPANATINVNNNKVQGFKQSVVFYDQANSGLNAYTGYGNIPAAATVNVSNNSFTGDSISINNGAVGAMINGNCNWYGSAAVQNVLPKISATTVNYTPWLTNGTDADAATGFQPLENVCNGRPVKANIVTATDVKCNGASNGSIDVSIQGGLAPFVYAWSKDAVQGFSSIEDLTNLSPGVYKVKVTDANGSIDSVSATITQPDVLTATSTGTNNKCFGDNKGTATVAVMGGTLPYTYSWDNGAVIKDLTGLIAGNYSVTVTDANGCTVTSSYEVTQPTQLTATSTGTNNKCFGDNKGTATVAVMGGTLPYTYSWDNGAVIKDLTGLVAGNYSVTVTDANGCIVTSSYEVTQPTQLTATSTGTNSKCFGDNKGTATVAVIGGTSPYTYSWNNGAVIKDLTGLIAGNYSVIVTDANGCTVTSSYEVTQPTQLTATSTGTNSKCFGDNKGTATVTVMGGTLPYTYSWNNGAVTKDLTNLIAGNYSVTVTDANGCTVTSEYEVTQPTQLTATITSSSTSCSNTATVMAAGGTGSYSYAWSNGALTAAITSVPAGAYSVTVTDANGCATVASVTLTATEAFNPSAQITNVTCYNAANGSITVTNANAVAPFKYSIDGLRYQTSATFNNLAAGTYTVTVVDANGCTGFITKSISQPTQLTVVQNSVQTTCFGKATGALTVTAAGGTGGLTYQWSGPNGFSSTQKNISNLVAGSYVLTVTDNNGCKTNLSSVVPSFNSITINSTVNNIACKGEVNGSISLTVSGGSGNGFAYLWNTGATTRDIANLTVGNYNVTITDKGSSCVETRSFSISQPASIVSVSVAKTNVTGCGDLLGSMTATASGGTAPYQYKINNESYQSANLFSGLYAGNYTVSVRDASGCIKSTVVSITDNGSDLYESNNSKNQAAAFTIGRAINARIALSTDVADWFKFTTPAGSSSYTVTVSHPSVTYLFSLYATGNNTPAIIPTSSAPGTKTYTLAGGATYYISITGGLSYNCYQLLVAPTVLPGATTLSAGALTNVANPSDINPLQPQLQATVYPNPHNGVFNLKIISPENGNATIEFFTALGQKVMSKRVTVHKGDNVENFSNIKQSLLMYKVTIGKQFATGKVVGPN